MAIFNHPRNPHPLNDRQKLPTGDYVGGCVKFGANSSMGKRVKYNEFIYLYLVIINGPPLTVNVVSRRRFRGRRRHRRRALFAVAVASAAVGQRRPARRVAAAVGVACQLVADEHHHRLLHVSLQQVRVDQCLQHIVPVTVFVRSTH